ncbi:MAG: helicase [Gammaproteobacteria bacterium]|nr:helicase [Gammaproteobacteria bacterium]
MTITPSSPGVVDTSPEVRDRIVKALHLDLVGPSAKHSLDEEKFNGWERPSNWYLTGFLVPSDAPLEQRADADEEDDAEDVSEGGLPEESQEERKAAKPSFFPSSMGLSFLVPQEADMLEITVRWGDYAYVPETRKDGEREAATWQRHPQERDVRVSLGKESRRQAVPDSGTGRGLALHVLDRPVRTEHLPDIPAGTRSVSVFLVNEREADRERADAAYAFQAEVEVSCSQGFVLRRDPRTGRSASDKWDEDLAELHYHDTPEYATGHGVSADWEIEDGACRSLRTSWIPAAFVAKTETVDRPNVVLSMDDLGSLADGSAAKAALEAIPREYRAWIESMRAGAEALSDAHRETSLALLEGAAGAADRIERGIALLAQDADVLDAFRVANRAVAEALRRRLDDVDAPEWRAFQLAFILLNLPGLADPRDADRGIVDLLFFPTGGGKTEAYLGLAAIAMVLRRLRDPDRDGLQGVGVSVVMRYTLRLLTLDQLSRASGLVCALELEREQDPARYGAWPFEIGLWVGKAATPNVMGRKGERGSDSARAKTNRFKADPNGKPSPIPLEDCPWCGSKFTPDSFELLPNADAPDQLRIACADFACDFSGDRPLPIIAVDEPLYRRLPAFLIATVDKFASLPWVGETGALLGGAERYDDNGFYGPVRTNVGRPLSRPVPPPDLVIQDELHLISGPLGTMVGLYESTIGALCQRGLANDLPGAKIVASTATARAAQNQIQALFARSLTRVFPPPGPNRKDSFFAHTKELEDVPGRLYLGIVSPGRNPKVLMRRVWLALFGAAQKAYEEAGGEANQENPADPYMTVLGYFNSLRELGGARRILEEEVQTTMRRYRDRRRVGEAEGLFENRLRFSEVVELTSRVPTNKVADARRRLGRSFHEREQRVDSAIATNMISVGLDITRLGLMVVLGQPKTHAEYIQATSRVGRDDQRPGLVVTLLNVHKPRDRSHYERFRHYHETFYRSVEASSVTPFSARALDRGFAGALVGLARHLDPALTPPEGVESIDGVRVGLERRLLEALTARLDEQPFDDEGERGERRASVQHRVVDLLDAWSKVVDDYRQDGVSVAYRGGESRSRKPLLRDVLDKGFESPNHRKFRAHRSLRDVEPEVGLRLQDLAD